MVGNKKENKLFIFKWNKNYNRNFLSKLNKKSIYKKFTKEILFVFIFSTNFYKKSALLLGYFKGNNAKLLGFRHNFFESYHDIVYYLTKE